MTRKVERTLAPLTRDRQSKLRLLTLPSRSWLLALVACLTLIGAASPEKDAGAANDKPARALETIPQPSVPAAQVPGKAPDPDRPCMAGEDNRESDICAQWKAADAARDAANWGWWQMVLSALGLAGLLYSLFLTRKATKAAITATGDAKDATAIAAKSVDLVERQGKAQIRAYLSYNSGWISSYVNEVKIRPIVANSGQSPAFDVRIIGEIQYPACGNEHSAMPCRGGRVGIVSAGAEQEGQLFISWDDVSQCDHLHRHEDLCFVGAVSWSDVFGKSHFAEIELYQTDIGDLSTTKGVRMSGYTKQVKLDES